MDEKTVRALVAGMAMGAYIQASSQGLKEPQGIGLFSDHQIVKYSVDMADALMEELNLPC